jgi:glycosyltransferase involved in cell wall biosynthesis
VHIRIVMPAYNAAPWIGAALRSVLAQTHAEWSLVVVDDGSADATAATAEALGEARIQVLRQDNAGVSAARNRGMEVAGGDALLFLDADDWLAPDALSRLAAALGDAGAAYGAFCFVDASGETVLRRKPGPFPAGDILERLLVENLFANGGHLLIRRAVAEAAGRFRVGMAYGEDWEYWVRVALHARFAVVPGGEPLLYVRQLPSGAYLRMAGRAESFRACLDAAFANPELGARLGAARVAALRRQAEAESAWVIGRELIRHGAGPAGRRWLWRSLRDRPLARRVALTAAAHVVGVLPAGLRGPFRPHPPAS